MIQAVIATSLAAIVFAMTIGIFTASSLLVYKIIFKRFSTQKQLLAVSLIMTVILIVTTVGYYRLSDVKLSGWAGVEYYATIILVGCFVAKLLEQEPSKVKKAEHEGE